MKTIKCYQVDAFTDCLFSGNPAAVCLLEDWLDDALMQSIAAENNLSETAFVVPREEHYEIRWFTPNVEVALCGHATLASGFVLFQEVEPEATTLAFVSPHSGPLRVFKEEGELYLDFPTDTLRKIDEALDIHKAIGISPLAVYRGKYDLVAVLETEAQVRAVKPDFAAVKALAARGLIITAAGEKVDFVSRFFVPQVGIDEDPVTGSAHTTLTPLWSEKLQKRRMKAAQLSKRGGVLHCQYHGDRCFIGGKAVLYLRGDIFIK